MDLQTRKIQLIQEVLRVKSIEVIEKLEKTLFQEKEKMLNKELNPMSLEEFNSIIDSAEKDSANNRLYNAGEILNDIDSWK
jgi:16S rRNA A1518/A1519 N6-dimethyltransferase RsmA/KsgA/DIM1 with predicted DNA glycosylase/AP lyase activity